MNYFNNPNYFTHFENLVNKEYSKKYLLNEISKLFPKDFLNKNGNPFTSLFTVENGNPKTSKGNKLKVHTKILHMSPHTSSKNYFNKVLNKWIQLKDIELERIKDLYLIDQKFDKALNQINDILDFLEPYKKFTFNFCSMASNGCIKACLFKSGNPIFDRNDNKTNARHKRSIAFFILRPIFLRLLKIELNESFRSFKNSPKFKDFDILGIRLNGTQDSKWESIYFDNGESVINYIIRVGRYFGIKVKVYDYTKILNRHLKKNFPKEYHLTFSYSGDNESDCVKALNSGLNVSIPFINGIPKKYYINNKWYEVFNGDSSDCRFLDPKNVIVGLGFKFNTKDKISRDIQIKQAIKSGFAIDTLNNVNCKGVQ